ncbi:hypothetical protein Vafri_3622 [Volvox africanus]|uniref:Uncharacterized protein n=1 Tax=Volvox africanus TaxID=51714 RepID=A0A8J4AUR0_9CHLO|nr:hypothetical protein Vafri_3622 [Volvox africanus]
MANFESHFHVLAPVADGAAGALVLTQGASGRTLADGSKMKECQWMHQLAIAVLWTQSTCDMYVQCTTRSGCKTTKVGHSSGSGGGGGGRRRSPVEEHHLPETGSQPHAPLPATGPVAAGSKDLA